MNTKFDFLNDHSEQYLEMAFCADYLEALHYPDGHGKNTGDCGDTVEVFLCTAGERISDISFRPKLSDFQVCRRYFETLNLGSP